MSKWKRPIGEWDGEKEGCRLRGAWGGKREDRKGVIEKEMEEKDIERMGG